MSTTGKFSRHQKNLQVIPRVALVYDRLTTEFGGAEQVLQVLHEIYPTAPVFTTVYDPQRARYANTWQVRTSWLQKCPGAQFFYRSFVWLMPLAIEDLPLSNFDIVISISSAEGKGVLTKPEQLHVCYMLTPTRYLWSHTEQYAHHPLTGWLRAVVFGYVRWWDKAAAFRPDYVIPISQLVAQRTQRYYSRVTEDVLYPPVSTNFSAGLPAGQTSEVLLAHLPHEFWFMVCRLVSYKRVDLAIRASAQLHQPLVVVGDGPDYHRLVKIAQTTPGAQVFFERSVQPGLLGHTMHVV
jgi:glycosyltransferase involved in cell wall biosynthesis